MENLSLDRVPRQNNPEAEVTQVKSVRKKLQVQIYITLQFRKIGKPTVGLN
jgi:hypothetical protein